MKRILLPALACLLALALGSGALCAELPSLTPAETAETALAALKARDRETLALYYDGNADYLLDSFLDTDDLMGTDRTLDPAALEDLRDSYGEKYFGFDYEILDSEILDGGTRAEVRAAVAAYDFAGLWAGVREEMLTRALELAFSGGEVDGDILRRELTDTLVSSAREKLEALTAKDRTTVIPLPMRLEDGVWRIQFSDGPLLAALSGGGELLGLRAHDEPFPAAEISRSGPAPAGGPLPEGTVGESFVEIRGWQAASDYAGEPALILTYDWTNRSEDTASAMLSIVVRVFQNGEALDAAVLLDGSVDLESAIRDVRPGAVIQVQQAFSVPDPAEDIQVEISDLWDITGDSEPIRFVIPGGTTAE